MTATEARQLLLIRALELEPAETSIWTGADRAWASAEASRVEGKQATPARWLNTRAALALGRLAQRAPAVAAWARPAPAVTGASVALVLVALGVGLASNAVAPSQRINLLAPPLLAVIAWNLVVYAGLLVNGLWPHRAAGRQPPPGLLQRSGARISQWAGQHPSLTGNPALQRFVQDWLQASQGLQTARFTAVLHLAAAALAAGALGGLYLHGLLLEFRAGWDSTFLGAEAVHRWLTLFLGPAAALAGTPLPDTGQLDALRFSRGPGENAARWIHLYAITTVGLVLLPRLLLALAAAWRAHRLQRDFPLPLGEPYFQRLLQHLVQDRRQSRLRVAVLPYSYRLAPDCQPALAAALDQELGPGPDWHMLPVVPLGGEDALDNHWPAIDVGKAVPEVIVPLFALTATPERDTHGRFLRAVQGRCQTMTPPLRCLVMLDEAGFRQRLSGAGLAQRLSQRRAAWQALMDDTGQHALFVDLGATAMATPA